MDTTHRDAAAWVAGYADYLRNLVGAADTTRARHLPTLRRFIVACSGPDGPDWAGLSVQQVTEFIRHEAAQRTGHGRKAPACATHSFLRFLAWRGAAPSGFDRAIPSIRRARPAGLPPHLSSEQLAQLLERAAAPRSAEYRDRAILLLLARLGLRAGEVATLEFGDLDWRAPPWPAPPSSCARSKWRPSGRFPPAAPLEPFRPPPIRGAAPRRLGARSRPAAPVPRPARPATRSHPPRLGRRRRRAWGRSEEGATPRPAGRSARTTPAG